MSVESAGQRAARYLGANLRERREELHVPQGGLAVLMSARGYRWSQQKVTKVERGAQTVSIAETIDLAAVLSTTVEYLTRSPERNAATRRVLALARRVRTAQAEAIGGTLGFREARGELLAALAEAERLHDDEDDGGDLAAVLAEGRAAAALRLEREG